MEENIADALKIAGSVLLFVMGLSISILSFSQARESIDLVLAYSDRESLTIENDDRFYYMANSKDTKRYVGKETIIPAIYRAYKESYKIVFEFPNDDHYLFTQDVKNEQTGQFERDKEIVIIDLKEQNIGSDLASRQFLNGILYRDFEYEPGKNEEDYKQYFKIKPNSISLYEYLTKKEKEGTYKIEESLGTFYIEDLGGTPYVDQKNPDGTIESVRQADTNKQEKRVITYRFIPK